MSDFIYITENDFREVMRIATGYVVHHSDKSRSCRIASHASEMYELIKNLARVDHPGEYIPCYLQLKEKARELLWRIDEKQEVKDK